MKWIKSISVSILIITLLYSVSIASEVNYRLAFIANVDDNWDLFVMDEKGKHVKQLTHTPFDEKQPSWSHDGKRIVYATTEGTVNIVDLATGNVKIILDSTGPGKSEEPVFSPDSNNILYVYYKNKRIDDSDLWMLNLGPLNSELAHRTTHPETRYSLPVTRYLFLSQPSSQSHPAYSSDGKNIVYSSFHCGGECGQIIKELWTMNSSGGDVRQLLLTNSNCMFPSWSPDNSKIAFSSDMDGNFDVWVVEVLTKKLTKITDHPRLDTQPSWLPDGDKLAFISTRSGKSKIWIKNLKNGEVSMMEPFKKDIEIREIEWSK